MNPCLLVVLGQLLALHFKLCRDDFNSSQNKYSLQKRVLICTQRSEGINMLKYTVALLEL